MSTEEKDGIIAVMPATLSNKIAAGEVVQRPASVVKELIENALDAGAGRIDVHLQGSGSTLIQIVDTGSGMSPSDALLAFKRHATSKVREASDLECIHTLGFRGEALASIASVSQVELRTRRKGDEVGMRVRLDGGEDVQQEPGPAAVGTSIAVRNLFFNVPARRNFLKRPQTELKHCMDVVTVLALSHPGVHFHLEHEGNELLDVKAQATGTFFEKVTRRAADLASVPDARELIDVEESTSYLRVRGVLGPPDVYRKSRGQQYLFVNGRYVKHRSLEHAVLSAYEYLLPDDTYPFYVLFLDIDPRHVDVNVHPAKAEVKFDDEQGVYSMLRTVVKRVVSVHSLTPELSKGSTSSPAGDGLHIDLPRHAPGQGGRQDASPAWVRQEHPGRTGHLSGQAGYLSEELLGAVLSQTHVASQATMSADAPEVLQGATQPPDQLLWQVHGAYILTQIRSGLVILDQQRAHERILYEQTLATLDGGVGMSQQLLFPQTVALSPSDFTLYGSLQGELQQLGFDAEPFGGNTVIVRGVPADIRTGDERSVLVDVIQSFEEEREYEKTAGPSVGASSASGHTAHRDRLARAVARRSAIQAGSRLTEKEMRSLMDQLFQCREPYRAPDGRATLVKLTVDEIRSRFDR